MKTSLRALSDLALPRLCAVCRRPLLPREKHVCTCCLAALPRTYYELLPHNPMADRFNSLVEDRRYCYAMALFFYSSRDGFKQIPQLLKYRRDIAGGRYFSLMLGSAVLSAPYLRDVDLVVPVPLHWSRFWKRGYNQARLVGDAVASVLGCPCSGMLRRRRRTGTQTRLGVEDKMRNVRGAFSAGAVPKARPTHILLVDDVYTTGATLAACHCALREVYGPEVRISAATLAYVGR